MMITMYFSSFTTDTTDRIFEKLHSSSDGLSNQEAIKRQTQFGLNQIKSQEIKWWDIIFRQLKSPFLYLLLFAALLGLVFGELLDSVIIILFVLINTFLGFYQEYRSEQTLKLLNEYVVPVALVCRGSEINTIKSFALVPGDIIIVKPGDILPADVRFVESSDLSIDESILTGESIQVKKIHNQLIKPAQEMYQAENIGFSGTTVVSGSGRGVVLATGKQTVIGEITKLTVETHRESSFEKGIARFSSFILRLIFLTLAILLFANVLIKGGRANVAELLIFSIALAVSVIPEALPVVTTFCLSRGALHLAKHKVVVKRLSAIEDLGSIEVLCTDKTGTLTENILSVSDSFKFGVFDPVFYAALSAFQFKEGTVSDAFDIAVHAHLTKENIKELGEFSSIAEAPFDPVRRRNSVVVEKNKSHFLLVRGAAEELITLCDNVQKTDAVKIEKWIAQKGVNGERVIAVAQKKITYKKDKDLINEENQLEFIGLVSFVDPLKKTAIEAVEKAKALGVSIKILTGDSPEVAASVAHKIGISKSLDDVITGREFDLLPAAKQAEVVNSCAVFARVTPEQKYTIIKLLQQNHEVGFLGEGINDAPALKIANVALVVSGASGVAREAADIILLKKSLNVVVDGIKEGREIFANTAKYIKATLASNFGNFYTVAIASLLIDFLPMLPLQILLVNLLTDFPMIAVATDSVDASELKSPKAYETNQIALIATILGLVSTFFDFIFFVLFYKISPQVLQTNWFIGTVLTELVFFLSIRTKLFFLKAKRPSNIMLLLTFSAGAIALILPFSHFGQTVFKFIRPSMTDILLIFGVVALYFVTTESVKLYYYRHVEHRKTI